MNVLGVHLQTGESNSEVAALFVDGQSLVEILREVERPFAEAEGHPGIAGGYAPLPAAAILLPSRHLLGEPEALFNYHGRVSLLECECGCPGCWPLVARITVSESTVSWSDFAQPHRSPTSKVSHWNYARLPPFTFALQQYLSALNRNA